jgi:transposase
MKELSQGKMNCAELSAQFHSYLTEQEISMLFDCIVNQPLRYRNRAMAIFSRLYQAPEGMIAKFLLVSTQTVKAYVHQFKFGGILEVLDLSKKVIKKHDDPQHKKTLFAILHAPPSDYDINRTTWAMDDLHRIMAEKGFGISYQGIRKIIKNEGYSVKKAKTVLTSNDPHYREKLEKITAILSNLGPKEKFFSIDEFGPVSIKIHRGRSLVPAGETKTVPQWQKSKGSLIVTAALELSQNQITHFYSSKKNTKEMIKLLEALLYTYPHEECLYFSWDAASWHASGELYTKVDNVNNPEYRAEHRSPRVELVPLPSCAQFLNVIESIFSGMARAIIHNSDYESVEACMKAIDRYVLERNQKFQKNPKRAGNKIWGKERMKSTFDESNNCKDPRWR